MAAYTTIALLAVAAYQTNESIEQNRKATRAQKRSNEIATADGKVKDINDRRQRLRQQRIRQAQIEQSAVNQGVQGGSLEFGAKSALATNVAAANAASRGSQLTSQNISAFNQVAADAMGKANEASAYANLAFTAAGMTSNQAGKG